MKENGTIFRQGREDNITTFQWQVTVIKSTLKLHANDKIFEIISSKIFSRDFHEIAYIRFPISISISFSASCRNRLFQIISNV